jgi:hypothetical protein
MIWVGGVCPTQTPLGALLFGSTTTAVTAGSGSHSSSSLYIHHPHPATKVFPSTVLAPLLHQKKQQLFYGKSMMHGPLHHRKFVLLFSESRSSSSWPIKIKATK